MPVSERRSVMRLTINHTKSGDSFYVIRSVKRNGKRSSETVKRLGTANEIKEKYGVDDAEAWARDHVAALNEHEEANNHKVLIPMMTDAIIPIDEQRSFNVGYLFLQKLYHDLKLPYICRKISERHDFTYDFDSILSRLVYERILYPSSKLSSFGSSKDLFEQPDFELHQIYRALSVISEESQFIQEKLYKNSLNVIPRKTGVLYYDCTNYFFSTEMEEGIKKYGQSKDHQPGPIVEMGLFIDRSGIPLAFSIHDGNTNEQLTLTPLEKQIVRDFELSRFIVCTDAGLSSESNRKFNNFGERSFITAQSVRKLNKELKAWALSPEGWQLEGSSTKYDIRDIEDTPENRNRIFYKQRYIEGYDEKRDIGFDQTMIVSYSLKYKAYQSEIRNRQVERARKFLERSPSAIDNKRPNDAKRFIEKKLVTVDGEIAEKKIYRLDEDRIADEARYDGFYAVCTNLDDDPADIVRINKGRWEIEESFRIMKSEFEARPVYLKRDDRIKAHFMTCFIALLVYRILENKLGGKYTCSEIIGTLRSMDVTKLGSSGYTPAYKRTKLTDDLHRFAGFRTDYELSTEKSMRGCCRRSKGL